LRWRDNESQQRHDERPKEACGGDVARREKQQHFIVRIEGKAEETQ
jgi:hypothetical protein